jgi:hypothetical protein
MGLEADLVGSAATATGDEILAAGRFTLTGGGGAGMSSTLEGRSARRGRRISSLAGVGAPVAAEPARTERPLVVAVSLLRVYLLRPADDDRLALVHTFDRRRVATTIHARLDVRRVILEDTWTGERFELEGERSPHAHVTATMHALSDIDEIAS